ncbi:MAG: heavy-metal-associated domain-containing protein [Planctomycetia bacterium]|nr:heavy-metal-associated domain-containing protein [Planctomycetia bacterium]
MMSRRGACGLVMAGLIATAFGAFGLHAAHGGEFAQQGAQCRVLRIQGMTCETCAAHVRTMLVKVPGVAEAHVNFPKAEATVCSKAGTEVPIATLIDAVKRAGYKATLKR